MTGHYPADVTDRHPHFNPPREVPCDECGAPDQAQGGSCTRCGEYVWTDEERREAAIEDAAERRYEAERLGDY